MKNTRGHQNGAIGQHRGQENAMTPPPKTIIGIVQKFKYYLALAQFKKKW
jgi:hypothetical protein